MASTARPIDDEPRPPDTGGTDPARLRAQEALAALRAAFIADLLERCDDIERLVLSDADARLSEEHAVDLKRRVHSLKGSGGTFGLPTITAICHQFEDALEADGGAAPGARTDLFLRYVDLLRRVAEIATARDADFAPIDRALEMLHARAAAVPERPVLVVTHSTVLGRVCAAAFEKLGVRVELLTDGLPALDRLLTGRIDLLVASRTLKDLNGLALAAALRASDSANRRIPIILLSSDQALPETARLARIDALVLSDQHFAANVEAAARRLLGSPQ